MWVDPGGFRWLNETWLKVDRGVRFYNHEAIAPDRGFLISRAVFFILGLGAVLLSRRHFAATLRGATSRLNAQQAAAITQSRELPSPIEVLPAPLPLLGMTTERPGLLEAAWQVARVELTELRSSPGLYLFVPLIVLETLGSAMIEVGFLGTPLLLTSGTFAVNTMGILTSCLCLLLMFYTVESLERERSTRLAAIAYATPVRSGSLFLGKSIAMIAVGLAITLGVALAGVIALLIQWKVGFEIRPFLLVWGLLLSPTVVFWTALVLAIYTITQNRYTTYALCLAVLCFTGYRVLTNQVTWVGNWPLWQAVRWSDISVLELDRKALFLSRLLAVSTAVFLVALTLACFRRRQWDATRILYRLSPGPMFRSSRRLALWAVIPLITGSLLALEVSWGRQGGAAMKQEKDYWRKNLATYRDAKIPDLHHVALHLDLFPETSRYHVSGTFKLKNPGDQPLEEILLTGGLHWEKLSWAMNGKACSPTDRAHLFVFDPPNGALAPGQKIEIGFEHEGSYPRGISKRAIGSMEFIVPSAVVLTSFEASIVPVIGFKDSVGIDDENRQNPKEYRDDHYKGQTDSFLGARAPFTTEITVTGPADFTINSVGTKTADTVNDGRRTVVWKSDYPVRFFNVVAGRWEVERGPGTLVFYDRRHPYNIGEIREARARVVLGKSDSKDVVLTCPFEPAQVIVDPDAKVFQLRRKSALARF